MLKDCSKVWKEISVVNSPTFQLRHLGKNNDIPIIIAKDIFKYPEKVKDFLSNGYWWSNGLSKEYARGGKSMPFGGNETEYFESFVYYLKKLFGVSYVEIVEAYGNCLNGNMDMPNTNTCFPHVDMWPDMEEYEAYLDGKVAFFEELTSQLAFNFNLTNSNNVKTGFYSFNNKKSLFDFNKKDHNEYRDFNADSEEVMDKKLLGEDSLYQVKKWVQIEDVVGHWKLEDIVTIEYNSVVLYPGFYFHSPYIKTDWFTDSDRVNLIGFATADPEKMSFSKENFNNVRTVWDHFGLNKIYGLYD